MVVPAAFAKKPASVKSSLHTNRVQYLRPDGAQVSPSQINFAPQRQAQDDGNLEAVPVRSHAATEGQGDR